MCVCLYVYTRKLEVVWLDSHLFLFICVHAKKKSFLCSAMGHQMELGSRKWSMARRGISVFILQPKHSRWAAPLFAHEQQVHVDGVGQLMKDCKCDIMKEHHAFTWKPENESDAMGRVTVAS